MNGGGLLLKALRIQAELSKQELVAKISQSSGIKIHPYQIKWYELGNPIDINHFEPLCDALRTKNNSELIDVFKDIAIKFYEEILPAENSSEDRSRDDKHWKNWVRTGDPEHLKYINLRHYDKASGVDERDQYEEELWAKEFLKRHVILPPDGTVEDEENGPYHIGQAKRRYYR